MTEHRKTLDDMVKQRPPNRAAVDAIKAGMEAEMEAVDRGVVLTESVMTHMLADIDQIVTEMEADSTERSIDDWIYMLRWAVDGRDYLT